MEISNETAEFIRLHAEDDPVKLRLAYSKRCRINIDVEFALTQIEARRKAIGKLPWLKDCADFIFPTTLSAEQCTAQLVADLHARIAGCQHSVLDATCGLGVDAMSLAKNADSLLACDISKQHVECANHNAAVFGVHNVEVVQTDVETLLESLPSDKVFSLIFLDPARRGELNKRTYALQDCSPDVVALMPLLKKRANRVMIKVSPMLDVSSLLHELPEVTHIYAISLKGECKELLLDCDFGAVGKSVQMSAINIKSRELIEEFGFSIDEVTEHDCRPQCEDIKIVPGQWLFEPNASMMKFINVAPLQHRFPSLKKLGINTHLYVGEEAMPAQLPGRVLLIEKVLVPNKRCASELPTQVNVVTRNYPQTPQQVKQKYKLKDGGDKFLYCCRVGDKQPLFLLCKLL